MSLPRELIDQNLLHYRIIERLGRGGMGEVYRAFDSKLRREVALKVLRLDADNRPTRRRRLLREARSASAVSHPGIVSIHEIGHDDGIDFIAMELVKGERLNDLIAQQHPLTVARAIGMAIQLAEALGAAHAAGIVHRDLKPSNIVVQANDRVKVLDFGIAKPLAFADLATQDSSSLTAAGVSPGTIAYMAPEQILGEPVDPRTDVFALGLVLFEMLTGRRPFGLVDDGLLRRVLFSPPTSLSELEPSLPTELEEIVDRCIAKDPNDRFPDMASVASKLRGVGQGHNDKEPRPVVPSTGGKVPRWIGFTLLTLLAVLTLSNPGTQRTTPGDLDPPTAIVPPTEETAYDLWQRGESLLERYDRAGNLDRATELFEAALDRQPDFAPAYSSLARVAWRRDRANPEPIWKRRALDNARHALSLAPGLSHARISHALALILDGELDAAREELETVRALDPAAVDTYRGLAEIAELLDRPDEAISHFNTALSFRPDSWELHAELGRVLFAAGRYEESMDAFDVSIELAPDNAFALRSVGVIYNLQGRYADAVRAFQSAIAIQPTEFAYSNLGTAYFYRGHYRESAAAFEKALELGANEYLIWANLGDAYSQIPGREERARESYRNAVHLLKTMMTERTPTVQRQSRLALYLARSGDTTAAVETLPTLGDTATAYDWYRSVLVHELAGQRKLALAALETALDKGHPLREVENEPDLTDLRADVAYHRLASRFVG